MREVLRNEQRRERTSRRSRVWVRVNRGGFGVVGREVGGVYSGDERRIRRKPSQRDGEMSRVAGREETDIRKTSVLFRSRSGDEPILIVLPTPFSQMTYCTSQRCRSDAAAMPGKEKTYVDFIILVFADGLGEGKAGAEEEIDGAAEETFGERRQVLVFAAVSALPASRLGEGVADRRRRRG